MIPRADEGSIVDMILLDWTRMGKTFCVAGAVLQGGQYRVVRPLLARFQNAPVRNTGWSAYQLAGHARWDVFELIEPKPAAPIPPHLEDIWVWALRPLRRAATPEQRRAILAATATPAGESLFGTPLESTRAAGYLQPGSGRRSLATLIVLSNQIAFGASRRTGTREPDLRVKLPIPELGVRVLACKDHQLLSKVEPKSASVDELLANVHTTVKSLGEQVAVRLGLSRPFQPEDGQGVPRCWLMADGFFSLADPQA